MSADFFSAALPLDADAAEELLPTLASAEEQYKDNIYVDATEDMLALLDEATPLAMTPNYPAFVALDRFVANRQLMGGHAFRFIPAGELATFHSLVERLDVAAAASVLDRGGNGDRGARMGLEALIAGIARAASEELGLLLVCFPA